ncbi:MAG TPA: beta-ketoacyl synthase N-terminal-like domain-containing protein [Blastocatellia bacterium]|nr:beta-ketoacyl synthase N-terminal-like domain-containing protein [Blastocatellia bacterium]
MVKIAITGIGIISPSGHGKDSFWRSLNRSSGAESRTEPGMIQEFDEQAYMDSKTSRYCQRAEKLALATSKLALADAELDPAVSPEMRVGVSLGSMTSNLSAAVDFDQQILRGEGNYADPALIPSGIMNSLTGIVSIKNGIRGFHVPVAAAGASSAQAIQFAMLQLESGRVDAVLAGGVEEVGRAAGLIGHNEISRHEGEGEYSAPLSEAAAVLLLESSASATRRGAQVYAECTGFGCTYAPRGDSNRKVRVSAAVRAMKQACRELGSGPRDIDLVFASFDGGGAQEGVEIEATRQFFNSPVPEIFNIKSIVGETLGASGALQVAAAALAIKQAGEIRHVLVNSFSRDGHVSSIVLRKRG